MKTRALIFLLVLLQTTLAISQELSFTVQGSKQGKLKVTTSKIENNEFTMVFQVTWVDSKMVPIDDKNSQIVFNRKLVGLPGNGKIICKTFEESRTDLFYFNNSISLRFEIKEDASLADTKLPLNIPFQFANSLEDALNVTKWKKFLAQTPRNFIAQINIDPKDIKDLTPPKITILSPEGVMDGFRPQIYNSELEVKVLVTDRNKVSSVSINNVKGIALNDSVYVAKVQFSRVGGTYPIKVVAQDNSGNLGQSEFFVETKQSDELTARLLAEQKTEIMISDVDTLIPSIGKVYENRYALIIGNEDYRSHQRGLNYESNVEFARRDAEIFKKYAINTLGIKESNVILLLDAKAVEMHRGINQLNSLLKATRGNGEAFVFFAGHGFPDEKTREAFIVPVDVSGNDLDFAIKLRDLYSKLTEHPSKGVTVFLDACFSGGGREQGLLAARAIRVRAREEAIQGKMMVLSASSGNESALPFRNKYHGMFTYFLLKALQETEGNITMGELVDYVTSKVSTGSIIFNNKEQNPTFNASYQLGDEWKSWNLNR